MGSMKAAGMFRMKVANQSRVAVGAVALVMFQGGCAKPVRPSNVAADAVAISGSKTVWWQQCVISDADASTHCRIWNAGGLVLYDETFLPYDERTPLTKGDLMIALEPTFPGPDRIWLTNGRVLLPQSRFKELQKFVDWLNGKRSTG
jgi:hypothetical protein